MFDRKYRPRNFRDVVGNDGVVNLLLIRSRQGTLGGRSMMFAGPKGCGKTSLARIVARAIVCASLDNGEPCNECGPCQSVSDGTSMSADEFDAATQGTVEHIRSIVDDLDYGTIDGSPRVIILDEAQRLSKAAQDALLKPVEERDLVAILCTTEPHKVGEALRSRFEEYPVSPPSQDLMVKRLQFVCEAESVPFEVDALRSVVRHLGSCPRTCVAAIETLSALGGATASAIRQMFRYGSLESVAEILSAIDSNPTAALDLLADILMSDGPTWVRDHIVLAIASGYRESVGAKATFPVPTKFFPIRGSKWTELARSLSSLDKPTSADIESIILGSRVAIAATAAPIPFSPPPAAVPSIVPTAVLSSVIVEASLPPAPPAPPAVMQPPVAFHPPTPTLTVKPKSDPPKPAPPKPKSIEIDGVIFTSSESLTTLDDKIEKGSCGAPAPPSPRVGEVELDSSRAPISEKDFARGFRQRIQKANP